MSESKNHSRKILWLIGLAFFVIGFVPEIFWLLNCTAPNDLGFGGISHPVYCNIFFLDRYKMYHWPSLLVLIGLAWILTMFGMAGIKRLIVYRRNRLMDKDIRKLQ